jgi:hypothetical protein
MIDLINKTVTLQGEGQSILKFDVWFATPWGMMTNLDDAISRCVANDMDPNEIIRALPVAVTETTYEVMK